MKLFLFSILLVVKSSVQQEKPKNVLVIMADDLGFNDVSFRGSNEIPTPNLDALVANGVLLNRFYTPPLCTPSRASFLTGKYPHKIGMQHYVIPSQEPWAMNKNDKLMPEYFKDAGFQTALVGKWHLGFYQEQYTPYKRGFDYHYGYLGPEIGYYDHSLLLHPSNLTQGYDLRLNNDVTHDADGQYITDVFTTKALEVIENRDKTLPLFLVVNHLAPHAGNEPVIVEPPVGKSGQFEYIADELRRNLTAIISNLDDNIGTLIKGLRDNDILHETVIVFWGDNGGPTKGQHETHASNYPLRGQKNSPWEGASRVNAAIYAAWLEQKGVVRNQLMHVSDILPTLLRASGANIAIPSDIDGVDQWDMINSGVSSTRSEVINIDDVTGFGSYHLSSFKLVNGTTLNGTFDGWLSSQFNKSLLDVDPYDYAISVLGSKAAKAIYWSQPESQLTINKILKVRKQAEVVCSKSLQMVSCDPRKAPCLFDIVKDPCERNNLASSRPALLASMLARYNDVKKNVVPSRRIKINDYACDPANFNNNWQWWQADS